MRTAMWAMLSVPTVPYVRPAAARKKAGSQQVEQHVADAAVDLADLPAQGEKGKGGHEQHFKEDVEVEEVARPERRR